MRTSKAEEDKVKYVAEHPNETPVDRLEKYLSIVDEEREEKRKKNIQNQKEWMDIINS